MDIRRLSALELGEKIKKREISSPEAVEEYLRAIQEEDAAINAYITVFREEALRDAREAQKGIESGELTSPLAGVPVAVKDNICVRDRLTTSASRMLENFRPPYDAHVVEKFKAAGAVIIGKTNLDEFAMGSSTETSYYGITKNPWDAERVPGG
ncbi:MAG: Asp-tRNA(Asn)/Glu-tRNA(Gln) amidotransferase subunit GatA, partial [Clostridiales Family XIII bacterium]|nr:Asp-tRNA(Asn)/Glu-tRNA(Gln) amidotransferase subunit GatA [Clostridiales Family XIII bacterium]